MASSYSTPYCEKSKALSLSVFELDQQRRMRREQQTMVDERRHAYNDIFYDQQSLAFPTLSMDGQEQESRDPATPPKPNVSSLAPRMRPIRRQLFPPAASFTTPPRPISVSPRSAETKINRNVKIIKRKTIQISQDLPFLPTAQEMELYANNEGYDDSFWTLPRRPTKRRFHLNNNNNNIHNNNINGLMPIHPISPCSSSSSSPFTTPTRE